MEPLSGDDPTRVADYQVRARLGAGGMGRVYLAYTPGGRPVALKVVRAEFDADPEFRERFRHEVDAARRVHGLYTAQVLDADPDAAAPWLVTVYVPGPSLQQAVAQHGPLPTDSVFLLMAGVAEALGAIHTAGIVHRDLKPSNVILAPDGPRVIDFGIAQAADASSITRQGMRVGSPQFMAPEQILDQPPAPAVDVFALGHLAAYAVLGRSPFGSGDTAKVFARILSQPPDLTGCPQPLRTLIERCLSKDPDARPTPAAVLAECREHQTPQTVQILETWLPPAMAATLAQHAAPPPPTPTPTAATRPADQPQPAPPAPEPPPTLLSLTRRMPKTLVGVFVPRAPLARAGAAVAALGILIGLGVIVLRGPAATGPSRPPHSSAAAAAAASRSRALASPSASPSPSSTLDPCVIGTWTGVTEDVINTINGSAVQFTGPGDTDIYRSDGTASFSYGSSATFSAVVNGDVWTEVFNGSATSDYQTSNGMLLLSDTQPTGNWTLDFNGEYNSSGPIGFVPTSQYTCSDSTLRIYSPDDTEVMTRAGG